MPLITARPASDDFERDTIDYMAAHFGEYFTIYTVLHREEDRPPRPRIPIDMPWMVIQAKTIEQETIWVVRYLSPYPKTSD